MVGSIVDIDDRRATEAALATSEERQAFQLKLSDTLRPPADPLDVQRQAARILGERLKAALVYYAEVTGDGVWGVVPVETIATASRAPGRGTVAPGTGRRTVQAPDVLHRAPSFAGCLPSGVLTSQP